jgi:hypothetical protein
MILKILRTILFPHLSGFAYNEMRPVRAGGALSAKRCMIKTRAAWSPETINVLRSGREKCFSACRYKQMLCCAIARSPAIHSPRDCALFYYSHGGVY